MTPLHLIRVPITINVLARWASERGWLGGRRGVVTFDEGRALHHLVDEVFGPGTLRPFRLLVSPRRIVGSLYAYSAVDVGQLRSAARAYALPDHLAVLSPDRLEGKVMPCDWTKGQRLGFDLRARPVRRTRGDLGTLKGRTIRRASEVDAFLLQALRQHSDSQGGMAGGQHTRETVYLDWLSRRLAPAAELEYGARLVSFQRTRVARGERSIEGPDATIHGTLTVTRPDAFKELLERGVGRHRAFGYGMLLLRPPAVLRG